MGALTHGLVSAPLYTTKKKSGLSQTAKEMGWRNADSGGVTTTIRINTRAWGHPQLGRRILPEVKTDRSDDVFTAESMEPENLIRSISPKLCPMTVAAEYGSNKNKTSPTLFTFPFLPQ